MVVGTASACASAQGRSSAVPVAAEGSKPPSETLSPLISQLLPNVPGKTFTAAVVDFPPDGRAVPHRHGDAYVYAYVLDGSIRSQLKGQPQHTYQKGEFWVEQPGADHVVTANMSASHPARLLVVFVSDTGAELKVDDPQPSHDDRPEPR
jgi:quercetin dioxygenase-like cupin family protein